VIFCHNSLNNINGVVQCFCSSKLKAKVAKVTTGHHDKNDFWLKHFTVKVDLQQASVNGRAIHFLLNNA
jgi:hypothetical protein